ncbi:MAG TPA: GntR family transcriptional regulator [Castellaniella sp.]|uniref:GntR family transcriptional regulator n=1 Tax=Castellaniella sp. TaxID=1955812 RepID=UPI002F158B1C
MTTARASKAPLSEQAYDQIKSRILRLEFRPGEFLNEMEICKMLDMGRTPVHQAVHRLMLDGLLDIIPRKGLLIRPESMNEILQVLEARWTVEPGVAALAAERATPKQVERLRTLLDESAAISDLHHRQRQMEIDHEFHGTIAMASGNPVLAEVIRPLHERSGRLWHLQLRATDDVQHTHQEHEAIYDAIRRGDKEAATRAMQAHLSSLRRRRILAADPLRE